MNNFKILTKIKISKLHDKNRSSLLKILHLYEYINEKNIFEEMHNDILNINDPSKLKIIEMRIESIMEDLKVDSYEEKIENDEFIEYVYKKKKIYFLKENKNIETIKSIIKEEKNVHFYDKKKKININYKNIKKMEENINNINKIIIKFEYK